MRWLSEANSQFAVQRICRKFVEVLMLLSSRSFSHVWLVCLIVFIGWESAWAGQSEVVAESTVSINGKSEPWRYLLHVPENVESKSQWPLLIFLHGRSIRGRDLSRVKRYGPPQFLDKRPDFPFIVVSPQLPDGSWPAKSLVKLLDEVLEKYPCDPDRVYLTGTSLGGMGAWAFAGEAPERFAAFAPVCGYGGLSLAEPLKNLPIRAYHGDADKIVSIKPHRALIKKIQSLGNPEAELIEMPGGTHSSIIFPVYKDEKLYEWFLKHTRRTE